MPDASRAELQQLIDRFAEGGIEVRRKLLEHGFVRLRRLAGRMLDDSFPALAKHHELDSVVNETWIRLLPALEQTEPQTVEDFFRLVAHKIRHVLLDMVSKRARLKDQTQLDSDSRNDPAQSSIDPLKLEMWSEFHRRVELLECDERRVFEMHYYLDIPKSQIAIMLDMPRWKAGRYWIRATERLTADLNLADGII